MHIRWKVRRIDGWKHPKTNCQHAVGTKTLTPLLVSREGGQQRVVWRIGPAIRQCCIDKRSPIALVSWWLEVETRFTELEVIRLDDLILTTDILNSYDQIMGLLEDKVPWPTQRMWDKYSDAFVGKRRTASLLQPHITTLGIEWPCSTDDLNQAWRTLAKDLHPDKPGGSQEAFVQAQASYQKLVAALNSLEQQ